MPLPPPQTQDSPYVLRYAPLWMDSVFRSKTTTEALLSSQRESGYLSPHDYEASITFLTNWHRQYPLLGALAGVGLVYCFRSPKWVTNTKRATLTFTLPFAGYSIGKISLLSAHFKYLNSIENPHGFQQAMEQIQAQAGAPKAGIIMERPYHMSPDDMTPDEISNKVHPPVPQIVLPNPSETQLSTPAKSPHTKWDEIRAANAVSVQNSTWDRLRQQHERKDLKVKTSPVAEEILWADSSEKVDVD
ncbi:hypothetical protein BDN70DRAFT_966806 [Pholiota conissans]|uniref:Uncharacterized protein n=1 Tax=Pholiota conissans TaxID=109636 RepID=A0A9P5YPK3_9AGAR|nr:hypothetical protein BDN70DRAFT_966806 [Pholiota conissans]